MKLIDISTPKYPNMFTKVDDADFDWLNQWKWWSLNGGYAYRLERDHPRNGVLMHREILKAPEGMEVDHINHDGLDNRRCNIRLCSKSENLRNRGKINRACTSKFIGVSWHKRCGKFAARVTVNGKRIGLGYFKNELDAAVAYNVAALKLHGEFAMINNIESGVQAAH